MAGDIILGYDGSDGSKAALAVAVSVARAFAAPLTIVFGYEPNPMGGETADYKAKLEKIGEEMVSGALAEAKTIDPAVQAEVLVVPLRPVESLLEAATERAARVIVVGGSGERPIVGAILGSVPHKLLHRSDVPILVVPAGDE
jgi:nucleotide-binding universal stress UspA family protein